MTSQDQSTSIMATSQEQQNPAGTREQSDNQQEIANHHPEGATGLFGYSQLHGAASKGHTNLLKSLLIDDSSSVDVNGKTVDGGYTPLHLAASAGHADCVKELLKHPKINVHVTDAFGGTPLETAERNVKNDVAKLLRSHSKSLCVDIGVNT